MSYKRTRIKMCGLKEPSDAIFAAKIGVDAIGLVFYEASPRSITIEQAQKVISSVPAFVTIVGLFYNASQAHVSEVLSEVALDSLQFHGAESAEFCEQFAKPYIKAIPMIGDVDVATYMQSHQLCSSFMLDAMKADEPGGSGKSFDWDAIPKEYQADIILAGGLTVDNVAQAIELTSCYAVDVSSGIEAKKGIKDQELMLAFVNEVNRIDRELNDR